MRNLITASILLLALLCNANAASAENVAGKTKRVIMIDPGHGGANYPGATYGGCKEKDINLQVALKLKKILDERLPGFAVKMTRSTDKQLSSDKNQDLYMRAEMARKEGAIFFISIHSNAVQGNTSACGTETHILGEDEKSRQRNYAALKRAGGEEKGEIIDMSDASVAALERAVIESRQLVYGAYNKAMARIIEQNYAAAGIKSRGVRQSPWAVLRNLAMPGVLTEIGFMTNAADLAFITSEAGQTKIAEALAKSVMEYVSLIDSIAGVPSDDAAVSEQSGANDDTAGAAAAEGSLSSGYTIQLLASAAKVSTDDGEFKSYRGRVRVLTGGGKMKYKYCFGVYDSMAAAKKDLKQIRKEFPDAYVVEFEGDAIKQRK
ncbi:MAG: N-acetylmuramoyl-L-alanine amidase [Alistipes sp.]|nr:N-acetylmuramoyl-L-alanine amidase [Alistipes sp.]